ncbi:MAG: hypothetical protein ACTSV6_07435 [Candidatus Heimdallarchaeota archaeon]
MKLSEIDLNASHLVAAALGAAAYHLYKVYKTKEDEKKAAERREEAERFGRSIAQYVIQDIRNRGVPQSEVYTATDELIKTLKEVKEELKRYKRD